MHGSVKGLVFVSEVLHFHQVISTGSPKAVGGFSPLLEVLNGKVHGNIQIRIQISETDAHSTDGEREFCMANKYGG